MNIKSFTNNTNNIKRNNAKYTKPTVSFPELGAAGAGIPPSAARQHQEARDWPQQYTGSGLRNAWIRIWIRITGRTMSRVLFRKRPWRKSARPS